MKFREDELKERATKILGINNSTTKEELRSAYRKVAMKVHPDLSKKDSRIMGVVSQAYALLKGKETPISLLESDVLVSSITGLPVTPIKQTLTYEQWQEQRFFYHGVPGI